MTPKSLTEELEWALDVAKDRVTLAQQLLGRMRSIRIGRLSVTWRESKRLDPVRLMSPGLNLSAYDTVEVTHEITVLATGLRVDQVLILNLGAQRIVAESRFYSLDFYRSAIAKALQGDGG